MRSWAPTGSSACRRRRPEYADSAAWKPTREHGGGRGVPATVGHAELAQVDALRVRRRTGEPRAGGDRAGAGGDGAVAGGVRAVVRRRVAGRRPCVAFATIPTPCTTPISIRPTSSIAARSAGCSARARPWTSRPMRRSTRRCSARTTVRRARRTRASAARRECRARSRTRVSPDTRHRVVRAPARSVPPASTWCWSVRRCT